MSSMVDRRSETDAAEISRAGDGGALVLLVKARFVVAAAVVVAAIALGVFAGESRDSQDVSTGRLQALRLDPNTVPPEVLTALPHVGASLVDRWVKAREERPFRSREDARARVRGLGVATLGQISPYFEFPDEGRTEVAIAPIQKTGRPAAKRRAPRKQKSAPGTAGTVGQPRLAASGKS
jgi:DNA uptake protein ComE-like DNA-binding protein